MNRFESMKKRKSYYDIGDQIEVSDDQIINTIKEVVELTPDAFNMQSTRVIVALGNEQKELWNLVEEVFEGKVSPEKIDSFRKGYGTVLYFVDTDVVTNLEEQFPLYAANFKSWSEQSSGMAQYNIWVALRELGLGASLQHYNPIIDDAVKKKFDVPDSWRLIAQMPFGSILSEAESKDKMDINDRVIIKK
ncbi:nitroreductase family protein [Peptostreptococcus faecalis]|uniref:nitroreductase family protein n=1 Tax=Peptostreptococcus faecalis TaxID=2045015 RepID=UPI000C7CE4EF|nr:nitroreductase family protein [Peptostreptococcus faecalis]